MAEDYRFRSVVFLTAFALAGFVLLAGGSPAWAVLTDANITAIGSDGTRLPIKSLKISKTGEQPLVSVAPDQDSDDDDVGTALVRFDPGDDQDEEDITVTAVITDPDNPSRTYEIQYQTRVPVGGQVNLEFTVDRAAGTVTGQRTSTRDAGQLDTARALALAGVGIPSAFIAGLQHKRTLGWIPGAKTGNVDGQTLDLNGSGDTWEALTRFFFGQEPWLTDEGVAPTGPSWSVKFAYNIGTADEDQEFDLSGFQDRQFFSVAGADQSANLDTLFTSQREVDINQASGSASFGYDFPGPGGTAIGAYGQLSYTHSRTEIDTDLMSINPVTWDTTFGFLNEKITTQSTSAKVGANLAVPLGARVIASVMPHIGVVYMDTNASFDDCFSQVQNVACGAGNTVYSQSGFDQNMSGFSATYGFNADFTWYVNDLFAISAGGGAAWVPQVEVNFPNQLGEVASLGTVTLPSYMFGISGKVNLSDLFLTY